MQAGELSLLLNVTKTFAISPTPIHQEVPYGHTIPKTKGFHHSRRRICPLGLVKATVLDANAEWTEIKTFGCLPGAESHEVKRKAGVLIEFDAPAADEGFDYEAASKTRHVTLVPDPKDEGVIKKVQMVVAKKAIIMPWKDYKPVADARRKAQREGERRAQRISKAVRAVGGKYGNWHEERPKKPNGETDYDALTWVYAEERATVDMPMLIAEEFAKLREIFENKSDGDQGAWDVTNTVGLLLKQIDLTNEIRDGKQAAEVEED